MIRRVDLKGDGGRGEVGKAQVLKNGLRDEEIDFGGKPSRSGVLDQHKTARFARVRVDEVESIVRRGMRGENETGLKGKRLNI